MREVSAREGAAILARGGVVLAPTETVVGLMAGEEGLERLAEIKGRHADKPIALLCADEEQAFGLAREVPEAARALARRLWPGPLTLVLDAPGGGTVGVRVPDHPTVRALIEAFGGPVYATSANVSGQRDVGSLEEVDPRVAEAVDAVVAGEPGGGEASAVVAASGGEVRVLRAGAGIGEPERS